MNPLPLDPIHTRRDFLRKLSAASVSAMMLVAAVVDTSTWNSPRRNFIIASSSSPSAICPCATTMRARGSSCWIMAAADWISLAEAAEILAAANIRFRTSTIGAWARSGKLQSIKLGGRRFVRRGERVVLALEKAWNPADGAPVFTLRGRYTARGWTDWTQGFQFGSAILQYDATGEAEFLDIGRSRTVDVMAPHITHVGVHDHGFNNISTYGNLRRLILEGRIARDPRHLEQLLNHLPIDSSSMVAIKEG